MGKLDGKVAFITGAARGQGRAHAVRMAEEGADIIALDLCADLDTVQYPMPTETDLAETVRLVEAVDRRIIARKGDVRDLSALKDLVAEGVSELGRLDIVVANAGVNGAFGPSWEVDEHVWDTTIGIDMTGVWKTTTAAIPAIIGGGRGGSIVLTSSLLGLKGMPNVVDYVVAKHGVVGLMRTLALELAPYSIRVNSVHPGNVDTPIFNNDALRRLFVPDSPEVTDAQFAAASSRFMALPIPWLQPIDIANATLWLVSDEARYVTGVALPVDAGWSIK